MKKIFLLLVLVFFALTVRAEQAANSGINLQQLQQQINPILQNIDTNKILNQLKQVQPAAQSQEPKDGDLCDVKKPEQCKEKTMKYEDLKPKQKELLDAAEKAMSNSYSPYSKFKVGAAVLTEEGNIVVGTNYENAAYPSGICAERVAILAANAQGHRKLKKIAVIAQGPEEKAADTVTPCGSCRQVINESSQLATEPIEIIMSNTAKDKIIIKTIDDLLPMSFGPKNLS